MSAVHGCLPLCILAVALALGRQAGVAHADEAGEPVAVAPANPAATGDSGELMSDIEESLVCQCGCGLTVRACNHLNCPSAIPMRKEIAERVGRGETKDQILAYYRERYGEKVLSSPIPTGFNLLAWIAPFAGLLIGGAAIARVARRWRRETLEQTAPPGEAGPPVADEYRARLDRELEEFDR